MKLSKVLLLAMVAGAVVGCDDDGKLGVTDPGPLAKVRFINAVPDTGAVNLRFVDRLENLPTFLAVPFRGGSGLYQGITPGSRQMRVFPLDTTVAGASTRLVDTTFTFEANQSYTILYAGQTKAPNGDPLSDRLVFLRDDVPTPGSASIAVQVIHAAVGTGAVDVYIGRDTGTVVTAPVVSKISNLAYLARTAYTTLPPRPRLTDSLYTVAVTAPGSTTKLFQSTPNEPGLPISGSVSAQAGVQIANSVMTVVLFPRSTAGTRAATTAPAPPAAAIFLDNIPAVP